MLVSGSQSRLLSPHSAAAWARDSPARAHREAGMSLSGEVRLAHSLPLHTPDRDSLPGLVHSSLKPPGRRPQPPHTMVPDR